MTGRKNSYKLAATNKKNDYLSMTYELHITPELLALAQVGAAILGLELQDALTRPIKAVVPVTAPAATSAPVTAAPAPEPAPAQPAAPFVVNEEFELALEEVDCPLLTRSY